MVTTAAPSEQSADQSLASTRSGAVAIAFPDSISLTDELICELSRLNDSLRLERDEQWRLLVSPGPDFDSDDHAAELIEQISIWNRARLGRTLIPSTTLHLPDDNLRMPDAGWLSPETAEQARSGERPYPHVVPDFVVEVRSSNDRLPVQQDKMDMWMRNGVRLGWLVDPLSGTVWVYRPDAEPEELQHPSELSADPPCEGLTISFERVWQVAE